MGAGADAFSAATLVPPQGAATSVDLRGYTLQPGEPVASEYQKPHTAWWKWVAQEDGYCIVDTLPRNWFYFQPVAPHSLIAIYTGSSVTSLTRVGLSSYYRSYNEDQGDTTVLRFYAQRGRTYYIQLGTTTVTAENNMTRFTVRPLPSKLLRKVSHWTYLDAEGKRDFAGMSATVNPSGVMSGKLQLRSGSYSFTGAMDLAGFLKVSIQPKPKKGELPPNPLTLYLSGGVGGPLRVEIPGNSFISAEVFDALPTVSVPVGNWSGYSQFLGADSIEAPMMVKVKPNKTVSIAARAPDGVALTVSAPILTAAHYEHGGISFMKWLGKGGWRASLHFRPGSPFSLADSGSYSRPENPRSAFYPAGLFSDFYTYVYPYTKPAAGQRAAGFLNASAGVGKLRIDDPSGELGGSVDLPLTFDTNNKFVFTVDTVRQPALKVNTTTGQVTGSIILAGKKRTIMGAISPSSTTRLIGYITGTTKNVRFRVIP